MAYGVIVPTLNMHFAGPYWLKAEPVVCFWMKGIRDRLL